MSQIEDYIVNISEPIRNGLKKMNKNGMGFVACTDEENKVVGVMTDGDFRRAVLEKFDLDSPIGSISTRDFYFVEEGHDVSQVEKIFETTHAQQIPVLKGGELVRLIKKSDFYNHPERYINERPTPRKIDSPVIIMAGGKGTRLDPFTRVLPKPLIPVGDKPIIQRILENFHNSGVEKFYLTLNFKANMIKAYLEEFKDELNIEYVEEDKFLGTAGALKFFEDKINTTFIVSNADILVDLDLPDALQFHKSGEYALTLVGSMKHHIVPYGVCKIDHGGRLNEFDEKPTVDLIINTGVYIAERTIFELIPADTFFNMTDIISELQSRDIPIGVYPLNEHAWKDIGQWDEYKRTTLFFDNL